MQVRPQFNFTRFITARDLHMLGLVQNTRVLLCFSPAIDKWVRNGSLESQGLTLMPCPLHVLDTPTRVPSPHYRPYHQRSISIRSSTSCDPRLIARSLQHTTDWHTTEHPSARDHGPASGAGSALPLQNRQDPGSRLILCRERVRTYRYRPLLCREGHQQAPHGWP